MGGEGRCLGDIPAIAGLAGGISDVTHLQAALPSFEPRLGETEADGDPSGGALNNKKIYLKTTAGEGVSPRGRSLRRGSLNWRDGGIWTRQSGVF